MLEADAWYQQSDTEGRQGNDSAYGFGVQMPTWDAALALCMDELPVLGVFFRGEATTRDMEDVLIFITPHILKQRIGAPGTISKVQP